MEYCVFSELPPAKNGGSESEGYSTVKVAIRHKRRLTPGYPPFILPRLRGSCRVAAERPRGAPSVERASLARPW